MLASPGGDSIFLFPFTVNSSSKNTGNKCLGEGERIVVVRKVIRQEQDTEFSMEDSTQLLEVIQM